MTIVDDNLDKIYNIIQGCRVFVKEFLINYCIYPSLIVGYQHVNIVHIMFKGLSYLFTGLLLVTLTLLTIYNMKLRSSYKTLENKYTRLVNQQIKATEAKVHIQQEVKSNIKDYFTDQSVIQDLYQMMYDTHNILEKHKITYWIDRGTTIGAVRHQGIIPWDDNINILILHRDELKFQDLNSIFDKIGYNLEFNNMVYRISHKKNFFYSDPLQLSSYPYLEVSIVRKEKGTNRYVYANTYLNSIHPQEYYNEDKLFPLKKYAFGPMKVWGPKDAKWYINNYYGKNWNKYAVVPPDHSFLSNKSYSKKSVTEPVTIELTEELRKPAELKDNLKDHGIKYEEE